MNKGKRQEFVKELVRLEHSVSGNGAISSLAAKKIEEITNDILMTEGIDELFEIDALVYEQLSKNKK